MSIVDDFIYVISALAALVFIAVVFPPEDDHDARPSLALVVIDTAAAPTQWSMPAEVTPSQRIRAVFAQFSSGHQGVADGAGEQFAARDQAQVASDGGRFPPDLAPAVRVREVFAQFLPGEPKRGRRDS